MARTKAIPQLTDKQRRNFGKKVDKTLGFGPGGECWEWMGHRDENKYGVLKMGARTYRAHRVAFVIAGGIIPAEMCVLHTCDNPTCVRPEHLWLGTQADNAKDKAEKGRQAILTGESNGSAKLTAAQVVEIRGRYAAGGIFQRQLAAEYGVSRSQVGAVIRRETWRHIK